jgi:hypothetical protein
MLATKGYFKNNNFVNESDIAIPEGRSVIVTILEDGDIEESSQYTECQKQKEIFQDFFMAWEKIDEPLTDVFDRSIASSLLSTAQLYLGNP